VTIIVSVFMNRFFAKGSLLVLLVCVTSALWRDRRPTAREVNPVAKPVEKQQMSVQRRMMLPLSSASRPNVLHGRDWYAIWIYTPLAKPRVIWHQKENQSVLNQARQSPAGEIAVINGGYFVPGPGQSHAFIGDIATGQEWRHGISAGAGERPLRRWAIGWKEERGKTQFDLELMESHALHGYVPSSQFHKRFPYGMSGLLCLLREGEAQVWRDEEKQLHINPPGQWKRLQSSFGPYFRHAAMGWSADGRHLFFVVQHNPRGIEEVRDLFGRYDNRTYAGEGALLPALRRALAQLPLAQRPCAMEELPRRIENAVLLDGGHCASLIYRRRVGKRIQENGSWLSGAPGSRQEPRVPVMIEATSP
jgi:hypothetical protein